MSRFAAVLGAGGSVGLGPRPRLPPACPYWPLRVEAGGSRFSLPQTPAQRVPIGRWVFGELAQVMAQVPGIIVPNVTETGPRISRSKRPWNYCSKRH